MRLFCVLVLRFVFNIIRRSQRGRAGGRDRGTPSPPSKACPTWTTWRRWAGAGIRRSGAAREAGRASRGAGIAQNSTTASVIINIEIQIEISTIANTVPTGITAQQNSTTTVAVGIRQIALFIRWGWGEVNPVSRVASSVIIVNEFRWRLNGCLWRLVDHSFIGLVKLRLRPRPRHWSWPFLPLALHRRNPLSPSRERHERHTLPQPHVGEVDPPPSSAIWAVVIGVGGRSRSTTALIGRGLAVRYVHGVDVDVQKILRQDRPNRAGEEPPGRVAKHPAVAFLRVGAKRRTIMQNPKMQ